MSPPPRKIRATNSIPNDGKVDNLASLSSKYPQARNADPQKRLFDSNEELLLNDLDETTENEKLRKQIFKLNRVGYFFYQNSIFRRDCFEVFSCFL